MRTLLILLISIIALPMFSQDDQNNTYLHFQWVSVDNEQEWDYGATEKFWEKIHAERVKNGDLLGWDLWSLQPHGEDQNFQYLIVMVYDDPVKMLDGSAWGGLMDAARAAYPGKSDFDLTSKMRSSSKTRDLGVDAYLTLVAGTDGDFDMPVGTVSRINLMKVDQENAGDYVKAETEIFQPMHQTSVDAGRRGSWGLAAVMIPWGTDVYANYYTFDMYENYAQMFSEYDGGDGPDEETQKKMNEALELRELKWGLMGTLIRKVRKE